MVVNLKVPDPGQRWVDTATAAEILGRSRATVYDMAQRGVITRREVGACSIYWREEIESVAAALRLLEVRR